MTETLTASRSLHGVAIRPYRPSDHNACRALWGELTEHRGALYGRAPAAESDPGAGFEEYLTQLNLSGMWVADDGEQGVVGFVGLMLDGRSGQVDPVVVTATMRSRGIGRTLLAKVADEARRRGLHRLTVSPSVRDAPALHMLHASGFGAVATVTLSYDVSGADSTQRDDALDLFGLRFGV
jgi:N-acetylglutamate synthase-like GNAT family acetyltransferase